MSWQRKFQKKINKIIKTLHRDDIYVKLHRDCHGISYLTDGIYHVHAPYPVGYVSLAIYVHEFGHVYLGHCDAGTRKPDWKQELEAWGFTKVFFDKHSIKWANSVKSFIRLALQRMITEDITDNERKDMAKSLKALYVIERENL
jgi:hypothetical protein